MLILLAMTLGGSAPGDDAVKDIDPPQHVIVITDMTKLMQGDVAASTLSPGQLMTFTKSNGDWRYTPDFHGWVSFRDVVPLDQAVAYFTKVIKEKPTAAAFHHRGIAHIALGEWEEALKDLNAAIQQGDKSTYVFVNRGIAYRETQVPEKALQDFTQAIAVDDKNLQAIMYRGMLLLDLGHNEAALKDFDKLIALAPENAEAYNQKGVVLRVLDKHEESLAAFNKAIELESQYPDAYANRAFELCHKGQFKEAIADYERALSLVPDHVEFMNDYAWLLATCREPSVVNGAKAVELAKKACELVDNSDPAFLDTLAAAQARAGDYDAAVKTANKAIELMGSDGAVSEVDKRRALYRSRKPFTETQVQ